MNKLKELVAGQILYFTSANKTVRETVALMAKADIGAVCVFEGDRLTGMFSERDLMNRVVDKDMDPSKVKIKDVMTSKIIVAEANENIQDALEKMKKLHCRHMPVVEDGKLIGVISIRKLLLHDVSVKEAEIKLLDAYITYSPRRMEGN
ncbi:MAG: hypothetical protein CO189_11920 [candidate division Zixibacteria bacterium CG_4_9_14_3_um_filter_46_8]|nr:MAG: hypothetical protein CO189_11920 [candidate division Zixibacteria bacterium CG_4_9_14_3_um_filter_46_8]